MNKTFTLLFLLFVTVTVKAQINTSVPDFGVIDTADLRLKACDFEKDANAEVLFDKAEIEFDDYGGITIKRHKRIKIFNDKGNDEANITIEYVDNMDDVKAETINLDGSKIIFSPVESKLIYKQKESNKHRELVFMFPGVRSGSVIEFQYKWHITSGFAPQWYFQSNLPERYSEADITIAKTFHAAAVYKVNQAFVKDTDQNLGSPNDPYAVRHIRALSNVRSFKDEPFTTPVTDNLERVIFKPTLNNWFTICAHLLSDDDFGRQLGYAIPNENNILAKMALVKDIKGRADSVFTLVRNRMLWNKDDEWFTQDGVKKAWNKKTGNSTEINLALCRLMNKAGINAFPILVSTPDNGVVDPYFPSMTQFDKTIVCVALDSARAFLMDASGKHNLYNQAPYELLSTYGLLVSQQAGTFFYDKLFYLVGDNVAKKTVFINADIKAGGKMSGTANISLESYNRLSNLKLYKDLGEKKYIDELTEGNNDLKISSLKIDNMDADTLPLIETATFDLNLSASDENYIYFSPNLFTSLGTNPFLSENRYSDIDFKYKNTVLIIGAYTIPDGYKVEVLPKNNTIVSVDKSMSLRRISGSEEGVIQIRYILTRTRSLYQKEEYPTLREFYRRMYDMLNEQIVLKKI